MSADSRVADLKSAQTFLREVADAKTSAARKVKFLREQKISDDLILEAFKSIHPNVQIEEIMSFDDAFPDPVVYSPSSSSGSQDGGWGPAAVGIFSVFTGALAYLGAYTVRESEMTELRSKHEEELAAARMQIDEEIQKLRDERDDDREQITTLVNSLAEQSKDVRKTLETLQESLALIQAGVRSQPKVHASPEKTMSRITSLIDKKSDAPEKPSIPKPSWFNEPIKEPAAAKKEATTQTDEIKEEDGAPSFDLDTQLSALRKAMTAFQERRKSSTFSKSISTLQFYCTKILGDPTNQTFRAINKDNKRFRDYVQFAEGATDILNALGFTLKRNKLVLYLYEEDCTPYSEQLELVQEAQTLLKKLAEDPEAELFEAEIQTIEETFLNQVPSTKADASEVLLETTFQSPKQEASAETGHPIE